jgi:hypothetical protein
MQVHLQVEHGQVTVDGAPQFHHRPIPLRDQAVVALAPHSACCILLGAELSYSPGVVVLALEDDQPAGARPLRLFVGEPVARFSAVRAPQGRLAKPRLECYFPANCSLRSLTTRSAGGKAWELQTPEGAVVLCARLTEAAVVPKR